MQLCRELLRVFVSAELLTQSRDTIVCARVCVSRVLMP
jgi:hypothetical protein